MVNVAFWSNVALTLELILLVMVGICNTCRTGRKNQVIMQHGKEIHALIVNATLHKRQVIVGNVSVQLQLTYTVGRLGYCVLKDVIVPPYYVSLFKTEKEMPVRYHEAFLGEVVIIGGNG